MQIEAHPNYGLQTFPMKIFFLQSKEIGRASCREECRSRWSPYH